MTFTQRPGSRDGIEILSLSGPFTLGNMFQLQRALQEIRPQYLIFDIAQVPYMDSAGLGLLVNVYVAAQKHSRKVADCRGDTAHHGTVRTDQGGQPFEGLPDRRGR